jgi:heptosyltransferase-3
MKNMLLVRFGGLGDLLVTLPSVRFLRARFPEARLTLISRRQYGELFLQAGIVDEIIPEEDRRLLPLFEAEASAKTEFGRWLKSFDLIYAWTQKTPGDFLLRAPGIRSGSSRPRIIQADPARQELLSRVFFRKTVESTGETRVPPVEGWSRLPLKAVSKDTGLKVIIHSGSGSEAKRWPLRNFLNMAEELGERGIAGALVTGEAEEKISSSIEKKDLPSNWKWIRCPPISTLARLLAAAEYYLGNDSGVTHLAAACGADVVALFRSEHASAWRPLGRVRVLSAASLEEIDLEFVKNIFFSRVKINKIFSPEK